MAEGGSEMHVVLVNPRIPPNTGNVARLCAALKWPLHLVGELGFSLEDRQLRRAGLDYWEWVDLRVHDSIDRFLHELKPRRLHFFSKRASMLHWEADYRAGDYLVFGSEVAGLPRWLRDEYPDRFRRLLIEEPRVRSLNLASAVAAAAYESRRQIFQGASARQLPL